MLKKQILYFMMLASVTTILADGFGGGFATGAITGWGISTIANSANKNYDPVAAEEARAMRQDRLNEQREKREHAKKIKQLKNDLKKAETLQKQLDKKLEKAENKNDNKQIANLKKQIQKNEEKIENLQNKIEVEEAGE